MLNCNQDRNIHRYLLVNDEYVFFLLEIIFPGTICGEENWLKTNLYLRGKAINGACSECNMY